MAESEENLELVRQYLMFNLGGETYGVGIHAIREIIEYPGVTAIPLAPRFLHGVINLRGAVVPVLDLSVRFGQEPTGINRRTCIVVVEVAQGDNLHMLGVLVDGVTEVREVEPGEVERKPQFGTGLRNDFVIGMLRREQGFIPILDIAAVLSLVELETLIEAGSGADVTAAAAG
ncbi:MULTISPECIES: chemotaxis protein CheW [Pseudomonas]|uniref:chemotaxis protein CheW n=1 Tax=Pseudomonas TaxID=286 RepID=UPI0006B9803D|nr:chemotaxis protein CheW [Pseudomonas phenolilytica]MCQ4267792.1 chemotaxis protein CheW [Stutzerimonas degradans]OOE09781.1 chemotaxis protein CheW [Stutzerimonas degradans]QGW19982.1 chemotaxis protein CheW [Stutzerimonas degradans]UIP87929.1 purine-binding chemotaxis protein CheW [Pseudomonas phenolilytica]